MGHLKFGGALVHIWEFLGGDWSIEGAQGLIWSSVEADGALVMFKRFIDLVSAHLSCCSPKVHK